MKRTKNRIDKNQEQWGDGISGCRTFEGEDLAYHIRTKDCVMQQKEFIQEKMNENRRQKEEEDKEERDYAEQTDALTRMRGMLEDENSKKRADMNKALQEENQRMALDKKNREKNFNNDQQHRNTMEITRDDGWVNTMAGEQKEAIRQKTQIF